MLRPIALLVAVLVFSGSSLGSETPDSMNTVSSVDIDRYLGLWYEIARLPNRFQKNCSGNTTAEYILRDDGRLDVINRCSTTDGKGMEAAGVARIVDKTTRARLKVRFAPAYLSFLPMVWGDYWIIDLAPDYSYAVVGEPSRKYLWVLSRTPQLDGATYRGILQRIKAQGYDPYDLVLTPQDSMSTSNSGSR